MSTSAICSPSPTKSTRRTKAQINLIIDAIDEVVSKYHPMTCRQVFYQLVGLGVIGKSESEYKQTVCRLLVQMRRDGSLPYDYIADNTRWMRKPRTWGSLDSMLEMTCRTYRRAIWDDQNTYVEVWLEKDALAGVLVDVTAEWDVPLMVTRGYPSITFLQSAGAAIDAQDRPVNIYYFGDHDPSGRDIDRFIEKELRQHAPNTELNFTRVAVLENQIDWLKLPTRPTKGSDSRSKSFKGESVEVDAISPDQLRQFCEDVITMHIDHDILNRTRMVEDAERETLEHIVESLGGAA